MARKAAGKSRSQAPKESALERLFAALWGKRQPQPVREYRFHGERKWRFDFAWPEWKVAVECEGGVYVRGRHTTGKGFESDCEKYNAAAAEGWIVLRFTPNTLKDPGALLAVMGALSQQQRNLA